MNLSIILPIFNEEAGIETAITQVLKSATPLCTQLELLAVNDGSTDQTRRILNRLQKKDKRIRLIHHKTNLGYGAAMRSGIHHAEHDWIFFTDADLQFDVSELKHFFKKTKTHDFVVGFRKKRADPLRRKWISHYYNRIIRLLFGLKLRDVDCAFKLMKKSALEDIHFSSNSFFVSVELMVKAFKQQYKITEIGVHHFPRSKGVSKVTIKQVVSTLKDLSRLYGELT